MQSEMINQAIPNADDFTEFTYLFDPIFEDKWNELINEDQELEWQDTWDVLWQPIWN
jgi:hypothetical protein